jgi:DNA-binding transcriptional LysR family regulator
MNTLHFKYAVEVEKTGSISQAADNLFMAQPNLSKAIKELEDNLGIAIFERSSKGVMPTRQGKEFLGYAKRILVQLEKMESIYISQKEREQRQTLKVSIPRGSYISAGFANFVSELDIDKGIDISIQETSSLQTISNVADNGYNLGIVRYQTIYENYFLDYIAEKGLESLTIWEFNCLILMSKEHPLADGESIDFKALKEMSIEIVHGDNVIPYILSPQIKRAAPEDESISKSVSVYERGSQMEVLTRVPKSFMWVSPLPQEHLDRFNLVQRRCEISNNSFKDVMVYPKGYKLSATDKLFLNKLYEVKNEVAFGDYK